jgi:hypothetical protein
MPVDYQDSMTLSKAVALLAARKAETLGGSTTARL